MPAWQSRKREFPPFLRDRLADGAEKGRVAPGDCSAGAPTDPYVQDYRIRFLKGKGTPIIVLRMAPFLATETSSNSWLAVHCRILAKLDLKLTAICALQD